jgi:hypothetical protein
LCILSFLDVANIAQAGLSVREFQLVVQSPPVQRFLAAVEAKTPADDDRSEAAGEFMAARNRLVNILNPAPLELLNVHTQEEGRGCRKAGTEILLLGALMGAGSLIWAEFDEPNRRGTTFLAAAGGGFVLIGSCIVVAACRALRVLETAFDEYSASALRLHLASEGVSHAIEDSDAAEHRFRAIGTRAPDTAAEDIEITVMPSAQVLSPMVDTTAIEVERVEADVYDAAPPNDEQSPNES